MEYYLHYLLWWLTMGKWFWRWRNEKMIINFILLILGIALSFFLITPNLQWVEVLVATYLVTTVIYYLFDTGPGFLSWFWYLTVLSWGFHSGAILIFILNFASK